MEIIDAGTLSMDINTIQLYFKTNWSRPHYRNPVKHKVNVIKLDTVIEKHLSDKESKQIDLLVLDVEGFEEYVLKGFNIEKYAPKMIIEISDQHESFVNNDVLMNKFKKQREYFKNNYELVVNDIVDNVYINKNWRKDNTDLKKMFQNKIRFPQYKTTAMPR